MNKYKPRAYYRNFAVFYIILSIFLTVNGNYSEWSEFSACSVTCGNGTTTRTRTCTSPPPKDRGKNCSSLGTSEETKPCFLKNCPIHGNYSQWSVFSNCSKSCGTGIKTRNRKCSNPAPKYGGRNCSSVGLGFEVAECNTHPCSIDGGYSIWTEFTQCTVSCGNGTRQRTRSCSNPIPRYGGRNCSHLGPSVEIEICNTNVCPIHGGFSKWTKFSQCTKSCGIGTQMRTRNCSNPAPKHGGRDCSSLGAGTETQQCNTHHCPVNGGYTQWTKFSECTKSCGIGTQMRTRNCSNPAPKHGGKDCSSLGTDTETQQCNTHHCPVNGGYTQWTKFSECTKSCGIGTQMRTRNCSNPAPKHGGRDCSSLGAGTETQQCNTHHCPVNGGYTQWTRFSECTKSCGIGTQRRTRNCSNPAPKHGGKDCSSLGADTETQQCNTHHCPVNGGYTQWTEFSECSKSCGNGTQQRTRNCSNPAPKHNGSDCSGLGADTETQQCNTHHCPINGGYTQWTQFSACSKTCGVGETKRWRNCSNPKPQHGGHNCSDLGDPVEVQRCFLRHCPVHGGFTEWTKFSECSRSCGIGLKNRTRYCTDPEPMHGGNDCIGDEIEIKLCNIFSCPVDGSYTQWSPFSSCSRTCANGTMTRTRNCSNPAPKFGGNDCSLLGPAEETRECNAFPCPVNGDYSSWSNFSICSKSCGNGTMERWRNCSNPEPKYGGRDCSHLGASKDIRSCNVFPCPIHGNFSSWSIFSVCSKSCGNGTKTRTRNCSNPFPEHGGRNCSSLGPSKEVLACNVFPCPIHGNYSSWSNFGNCSKSCGNGTKLRTRSCTNPTPKHGGRSCSSLGPSKEILPCNVFPCPIHGNYSSWSNFSSCSKSCGNGTRVRTRECTNPTPKHGGRSCFSLGPLKEVQSCNVFPCPIHGSYSSWSNFSSCSKSCGNGTKLRARNCTNPTPKHGGRSCSLLGPSKEVRRCNDFPCPVHGNYSSWSNFKTCSKSCGNGTMTRTRNCTNPEPRHSGRNCSSLGPSVDIQPCNMFPCPVDGGYTEWGNFTQCTQSCGNGTMYRTRNCSNPSPLYGGKNCSTLGGAIEVKICNAFPCPIDGGYTSWSEFTRCSKSCGRGTTQRTRNCSNPLPQFGGRNCSRFGLAMDVRECNLRPCPINGGYSAWSKFSKCTRSCNGGKQKRWRQCINPFPKHGGLSCSRLGPASEIQPCNTLPCPVHGGYSEWTGFEACTRTCGGGKLIRRRNCTSPPPAHGGRNCSSLGPSVESVECNTQKCPGLFVSLDLVL